MGTIGVVDTTFSRIDMGGIALAKLAENGRHQVLRRTVPGVKDLPLAAKLLLVRDHCDIVLACGMPGPEEIDRLCAHEASQGLIHAQLMVEKPIIEVFVHMSEARSEKELRTLTKNRVQEHVLNLLDLLEDPSRLIARAGSGERQGWADAGPID